MRAAVVLAACWAGLAGLVPAPVAVGLIAWCCLAPARQNQPTDNERNRMT